MGWLRLVHCLKLQVSCAEYRLFYRALSQKSPIIFRSLLVIATPYWHMCHQINNLGCPQDALSTGLFCRSLSTSEYLVWKSLLICVLQICRRDTNLGCLQDDLLIGPLCKRDLQTRPIDKSSCQHPRSLSWSQMWQKSKQQTYIKRGPMT